MGECEGTGPRRAVARCRVPVGADGDRTAGLLGAREFLDPEVGGRVGPGATGPDADRLGTHSDDPAPGAADLHLVALLHVDAGRLPGTTAEPVALTTWTEPANCYETAQLQSHRRLRNQ
jgi:hypothetical protein